MNIHANIPPMISDSVIGAAVMIFWVTGCRSTIEWPRSWWAVIRQTNLAQST